MKIALAQLNYHTGNFEYNTRKIVDHIKKSKSSGADLVVFCELAICGYPPRDFLEFEDFHNKCLKSLEDILPHTKGIGVILGMPVKNDQSAGRPLYNAAIFIENENVKQVISKNLLPDYDIFDEYRYFEPGKPIIPVEFKGKKIALTVCEDIWAIDDLPLYSNDPVIDLMKHRVDFMINIAASPFSAGHFNYRKKILELNCKKYNVPLFYVNHLGGQTELIFDGGSMVLNEKGDLIARLPFFKESLEIFEFDDNNNKVNINSKFEELPDKYELIHNALILGISDYFKKLGFKKAILGLSGGIDSAIVFYLASKALGNKNVLPVLLPSIYTSPQSNNDAKKLIKIIGSESEMISINKIYNTFLDTLNPYFKDNVLDITEENLQSRIRGVLLMAFSNKYSYILLNTSNKSEIAVGYGTLYGDLCGGLSVIGDLYKTEVYQLCSYINRKQEIIPESIINRPPTAELKPGQKDTDSLPEYEILDKILNNYIEFRKGPQELIKMGFKSSTVEHILKLVNANEYKRYQTPPILRVSNKAFGMGRRMPIVAKYLC